MRYRETGEVHLDFHRTANGTIEYIGRHYGREFLDEIFRRTAQDVYRAVREEMRQGNAESLVEHWAYFFDREGGQYRLEREGDTIRMIVDRCPAIAYLNERGIPVAEHFCRQTVVINETLAEGSPFEVTTEVQGGGKCVQTIRRKGGAERSEG
ncbi:MAG: hypothetical protein IT210_15725 [Armatimonadetes bacterium]|nr:hypothetical protein [Armatimonadota bacterium]